MSSIAQLMQDRQISLDDLVEASKLEKRVVEAIACGRFTPSPQQRQRLADAFEIAIDDIQWGHITQVEHLYGHGTQFGRSP